MKKKINISKGVYVAITVLCVAIVLLMYFGRDRLVENLENQKESGEKGDRGIPGPRGRRGEKGARGEAGGEFRVMGRLADVGCLENEGKGGGDCYAGVNKLGGVALGKKSFDLGHVWQHMSDGKLKNMENEKCLNVVRNEGVGKDKVGLARCKEHGGSTMWHYDSAMRLIPIGVDGSALGKGKDGKVGLVNTTDATKWTFFD